MLAFRFGLRVRAATIIPSERCSRQRFARVTAAGDTVGHRWKARLRVERAICVCFAGPIAQRKFQPPSFRRWHAKADYDQINELALRVSGSGEIATAFTRWLELQTKSSVTANWRAIQQVAAALLEHKTLDQNALQKAIEGPQPDPSNFLLKP